MCECPLAERHRHNHILGSDYPLHLDFWLLRLCFKIFPQATYPKKKSTKGQQEKINHKVIPSLALETIVDFDRCSIARW